MFAGLAPREIKEKKLEVGLYLSIISPASILTVTLDVRRRHNLCPTYNQVPARDVSQHSIAQK